VRKEGAAFYWHLGDFRAIYEFDEDFIERHPKTSILDYEDAGLKGLHRRAAGFIWRPACLLALEITR